MLFGQIGFQCPNDGQVQAGFDAVEDMIVHEEGKTEISVRCPKCGELVRITSMSPLLPPGLVQQLAEELNVAMHDGKLNFSDLVGTLGGSMDMFNESFDFGDDGAHCGGCAAADLEELSDRELTPIEGNQLEFFARELEKIDSVDDFLSRVNEETR
ncbi:MAG: hypothetical protein FWE46_01055 [Coriobacteriia bacterium]|nr:hypothetical protein [Coriobacteriia bacterium]MCL2536916.1 hypothetical protein [Coriobacteriia bacterium]